MDIITHFERLGLSQKEAAAYLHLLQLGTQPASAIARKMAVPRSTAHFLLSSLVSRHFVTSSKKTNTLYFSAELPQNILHVLENEKEHLVQKKEQEMDLIKKLLPELKGMLSPYSDIPKITFYEGIDGVVSMFTKHTAYKAVDSYSFSASNVIAEQYPREVKAYLDVHEQSRRNNTEYVIDSYCFKKNNNKSPKNVLFKYFIDKKFILKTHIQIDGDHIGILNIENNPIGISIQHAAMAKDLIALHQQMWKVLPKPQK